MNIKKCYSDSNNNASARVSRANPRTEHGRHIKLNGDMQNNKMERMNGEIRDREKTLRGLKNDDSVMLTVISCSIIIFDTMKPQTVKLQQKLAVFKSKEKTNGKR